MSKFCVTYGIVTPESAEHGDYAEQGFVHIGEYHEDTSEKMSLREAMRLAYPQEDCGAWWSEVDGRTNYQSGAVEFRSIHPPRNITAASYARVTRIMFKN